MTRHLIVAFGTSFLLASAAHLVAGEKLTLTVSPNVSNAPSTVVVRAIVPRHATNRALRIVADSGEFYRSSEIQLDGEQAPTVTEIRLPNLPGGEYVVSAVLRDQMGHETKAYQKLVVLARFSEP